MKSKLNKFKEFLKRIIKKKRTWAILVLILLIVVPLILKPSSSSKNTVTEILVKSDLKETVLATGQVISNTDLDLSFGTNGIVKSIDVKVGDKVVAGQTLAKLNGTKELASLNQARGSLLAANAKLKKVLDGGEVELARLALEISKKDYENVKRIQDTLVNNAYKNLLNSSVEAYPYDGDDDESGPIISGTYNLGKEGSIYISFYYSSGGTSFNATGLTTGPGSTSTENPQPIGDSGLYILFPEEDYYSSSDWVIEIPNKKGATYLTNLNAYESALKNRDQALSQAESLVSQKETELKIKEISNSSSDIDLARAEILSAEGLVGQAESVYNDTLIKAPVGGTVTSIDIKIGELAQAQKEAIVIEDVSNVYIEANVNEANIASITKGLPVDITFDAFGSDRIFKGLVTEIDPSSTLVSGVVNYKITTSVEQLEEIRPGMTANMTIKISEKAHVLSIPRRAIITKDDGTQVVRKIINSKNKKFKEVNITTGLEGDGGMVEILNGLSLGDEYVVLIKK
ncbi:TPA: efflux RND transporter periplasmic adaptor subunit [Candidatus Nomurabacteria bacterium]|nr:MAG: Secretion protein HlyD [Parcubacteria bacterium RAAC4_OD1_1]HCY26083.1 efflux RND transporter periplasmic adaptor subunit [Candidatus Nomurabacteria bacterium]